MFLWTHLTINKTKTQCFFQKNFKKTNCNSGKVSFFQVFLVKKVSFLQDETKVIANFARFLLYSCNIFLFPLTIKNESDSFFKVKSGAFPAIFKKIKRKITAPVAIESLIFCKVQMQFGNSGGFCVFLHEFFVFS